MPQISLESWLPSSTLEADLHQLADLLHVTVHAGASVSFILPFTLEDSLLWWQTKVLPQATAGGRCVLVARDELNIVGSVQLVLDMPPNQQHRAEVAKLLVHPDHRRKGIARALMTAIEQIAIRENRTLLTLDTVTGNSAEQLYQSLGYSLSGVIPNFARAPHAPILESTSVYYKELAP
jgi:GNAT superfamily N-acetyltransferase